ncbi:MFS transporter [Yinghuangia seranimata]|uniref:MFS transporter n=1 Tax=Yinghuangia seranimata TaxID=408067 RepID=UPI00248B264A|nr:MFS transporter [Yinghuangia seranimata]MDI2124583.1 MFS transporter [Yinghuangia seranimata]
MTSDARPVPTAPTSQDAAATARSTAQRDAAPASTLALPTPEDAAAPAPTTSPEPQDPTSASTVAHEDAVLTTSPKPQDTTAPEPHDAARTRLVLALVCACQFMVILDASIVNVALPSVDRDLGFGSSGLAWVVNAYLLTFAGFMLLGGRAADLFGQRRMLTTGLLVFSAASLAGGLATTPGVLVAARAVQGVGAALLAPATLAVLNTTFAEGPARARAFGAWSAAGGVGGMAGALAGGALTSGLSWRWVFLINVPVGAALIAVAATSLTGTRPQHREPLDLVGAVTGTAGLAALVYGVMQSTDHGWTSAHVVVPAVAGLALLVLFAVTEARFADRPLLPPHLFRIRGVAVGNGMLLLFGGIAIAMWYFTSLFLQDVLGYGALRAGLGQTPAAVTFMLVAGRAAALLPRTGVRPLVLAGSACFLAGFGWLAQADAQSGYLIGVLGPTLLIAVGIGLTFPTLMAAATADAPARDAGIVGGVANTASQLGGSIGLALLSTAADTRAAASSDTTTATDALASGYDLVFLLAAGLALAIAATSLLLPRPPKP